MATKDLDLVEVEKRLSELENKPSVTLVDTVFVRFNENGDSVVRSKFSDGSLGSEFVIKRGERGYSGFYFDEKDKVVAPDNLPFGTIIEWQGDYIPEGFIPTAGGKIFAKSYPQLSGLQLEKSYDMKEPVISNWYFPDDANYDAFSINTMGFASNTQTGIFKDIFSADMIESEFSDNKIRNEIAFYMKMRKDYYRSNSDTIQSKGYSYFHMRQEDLGRCANESSYYICNLTPFKSTSLFLKTEKLTKTQYSDYFYKYLYTSTYYNYNFNYFNFTLLDTPYYFYLNSYSNYATIKGSNYYTSYLKDGWQNECALTHVIIPKKFKDFNAYEYADLDNNTTSETIKSHFKNKPINVKIRISYFDVDERVYKALCLIDTAKLETTYTENENYYIYEIPQFVTGAVLFKLVFEGETVFNVENVASTLNYLINDFKDRIIFFCGIKFLFYDDQNFNYFNDYYNVPELVDESGRFKLMYIGKPTDTEPVTPQEIYTYEFTNPESILVYPQDDFDMKDLNINVNGNDGEPTIRFADGVELKNFILNLKTFSLLNNGNAYQFTSWILKLDKDFDFKQIDYKFISIKFNFELYQEGNSNNQIISTNFLSMEIPGDSFDVELIDKSKTFSIRLKSITLYLKDNI